MTDIVVDSNQNNRTVFMNSVFSLLIELIESIDDTSSVSNFSEGYHHICYESKLRENITEKLKNGRWKNIYKTKLSSSNQ